MSNKWSVKQCEKRVKQYHTDGYGGRTHLPGFFPIFTSPDILPELPAGFKFEYVLTWGMRLVRV